MATIRFILSSVGDRPKVSARLRLSDERKVQTLCEGVLAFRKYWSNAKQTHNTKFVNPLLLPEVTHINKTLAKITSHVLAQLAATPIDEIDKQWLADEIDKVLHPEKRKVSKANTLLRLVEEYIAGAPTRIMPRRGKPVSPVTINQYKQTYDHLCQFLTKKRRKDIPVERLNKAFYDEFVTHLYCAGLRPNTVGKHIKHLKTFVNALPLAQKVGVELISGGCTTITEGVENIYLTEEELDKIAECQLPSASLELVRDQFILLAWTGCRFSDLEKLTKDNMHKLGNGYQYFKLHQRKTEAKVTIPILPAAMSVLERYDFQPPKPISNQKFNVRIKEVCRLADINDEVSITQSEVANGAPRLATKRMQKWECVTAHTARRSFATNMYKRNFPTLMIMAITGHKTEKAFLTYIKVSEDENAERMMAQFMAQEFGHDDKK